MVSTPSKSLPMITQWYFMLKELTMNLGCRTNGVQRLVLAEVAELAAQQYLMKNKSSQIIHPPNNERQAAILANTLLGTVR